MKKVWLSILFTFVLILPIQIKAEVKYGYSNVTGGTFNVRTSANSSASVIGILYGGVNVEIVDTASGNGCGTWYKIKYNSGYGWVCGVSTGNAKNVELYTTQTLRTNNRNPENDYEKTLQNAGFPSSYWDKLSALHKTHPNWNFVANKTNRDWNYVTWAETGATKDGDITKSLLHAPGGNTDLIAGYLKTDTYNSSTGQEAYNYKTNKFKMQDSGGFYAAREEMVAYFMDPRNFLNENFIFQFEILSYSSYQTKNIVESIFGNGYLKKYAEEYVNAGKTRDISPVHMATRSVQEGLNKETFLTKGSSFTYSGSYYKGNSLIDGKTFTNCYNFFNIGAYSDTISAAQNAGVFACDPYHKKTYNRPWNNAESALIGGAMYLGDYINNGQDTLYFEKWNTASYAKEEWLYGHQYMTNISAVAYEGSDTYDSYKNGSVLNSAFTFIIPVYNNMPEKTVLPSSLNPNNYLETISVDGKKISDFDGAKTEGYTVLVANNKTSVKIDATKVVNSSSVKINDGKTISLNVGDNKIAILVTAANGEKRTYYVNVKREAPSISETNDVEAIVKNAGYKITSSYLGNIQVKTLVNDMRIKIQNQNGLACILVKDKNGKEKNANSTIATGDKITITIGDNSKTYEVYVYGDVNGDGKALSNDYLMVRDYIMEKYKIEGVYKYAADVTKDNQVKSNDYLKIRDYIMEKISSL